MTPTHCWHENGTRDLIVATVGKQFKRGHYVTRCCWCGLEFVVHWHEEYASSPGHGPHQQEIVRVYDEHRPEGPCLRGTP